MLFFSPIFRLHPWRDPNAFIPTGNQPEIFLRQFSPTPQFRQSFSPTNPTMKDLCSFSLSTSDIFFFLTAPSPADSMQRMQIRLLFGSSLPWMNATLNEDTHFAEGAVKHAHKTVGGFLHTLSDMLSLQRWHEPTLFWASAYPDRWTERKDQRRVALATELLFHLRNIFQRRTCDPWLEKNLQFFFQCRRRFEA